MDNITNQVSIEDIKKSQEQRHENNWTFFDEMATMPKPQSTIINKRAAFAVKILKEYAESKGINPRNTDDISDLERYLLVSLYESQKKESKPYEACKNIISPIDSI